MGDFVKKLICTIVFFLTILGCTNNSPPPTPEPTTPNTLPNNPNTAPKTTPNTAPKTTPNTAPKIAPITTSDTIESSIDGDFEGWEGETIFKLTNGQIWQQTDYQYYYSYEYSPKVTIYKDGLVYKMIVEGIDYKITVERIK